MRLVIDANILFAALIRNSTTAELLFNDNLRLFGPEFLFEEFLKYKSYILEKTHRTEEDFTHFYNLLNQKITIIPKKEIEPYLEEAAKISPDPKDNVYIALSLAINSKIWSQDKDLKEKQDVIPILTTKDIINEIKFSK